MPCERRPRRCVASTRPTTYKAPCMPERRRPHRRSRRSYKRPPNADPNAEPNPYRDGDPDATTEGNGTSAEAYADDAGSDGGGNTAEAPRRSIAAT